MSTLMNTLNTLKAEGYTHIYAYTDGDANNGMEQLIRDGKVSKSWDEAHDAIVSEFRAMNPVAASFGRNPETIWIWSIQEEINNITA